MDTYNSRTRLRGKLTFSNTRDNLKRLSVYGYRRTPSPKHRELPLVVTRLGVRPMNDIDIDLYNSKREFITGNSKVFNNLKDFFKDLDD